MSYRTDGGWCRNGSLMWRALTAAEVEQFRQHARANYRAGDDISPLWHPVYREECYKINEEIGII